MATVTASNPATHAGRRSRDTYIATVPCAQTAAPAQATTPEVGVCADVDGPPRIGVLEVWLADLDAYAASPGGVAPITVLSRPERQRALQIACGRRRRRWISSRALLRELIGCYMRIHPGAVSLVSTQRGKPLIGGHGAAAATPAAIGRAPKLTFNCSHSRWLGMYAFAAEGAVGADVELARGERPVLALATRAFDAAQVRRLRAVNERELQREFLLAWVRHEALLKCSGAGLGGGDGGQPVEDAAWVANLRLVPGVAGALAAEPAPRVVRCRVLGGRSAALLRDQDRPV